MRPCCVSRDQHGESSRCSKQKLEILPVVTLTFVQQVARFNQGHTIADIRRFISASRPDLDTSYTFMTAFPSAELKDESAKLVDAGLLNAVVIQKAA